MKLDSSESSSAVTLQGPDVNAEKINLENSLRPKVEDIKSPESALPPKTGKKRVWKYAGFARIHHYPTFHQL